MLVDKVYRKTVQFPEGVKNAGRQCVQENRTVPWNLDGKLLTCTYKEEGDFYSLWIKIWRIVYKNWSNGNETHSSTIPLKEL